MPLQFQPDETFQFDCSEDWIKINGVSTKLQVAHIAPRHYQGIPFEELLGLAVSIWSENESALQNVNKLIIGQTFDSHAARFRLINGDHQFVGVEIVHAERSRLGIGLVNLATVCKLGRITRGQTLTPQKNSPRWR